MIAKDVRANGFVNATVAASAPGDCVRLQELTTALAGKLDTGATFTVADITDLQAQLPILFANVAVDTGGLYWVAGANVLSGIVRCLPGGGLGAGPGGLYANLSGVYSPVGHTHVLADITDFADQLPGQLRVVLADSNSLRFVTGGPPTADYGYSLISGAVQVQASAGLLLGAGGLAADFGSGHTQVGRGDALVYVSGLAHPPLTVGASQSLTVTFSQPGQHLQAEVNVRAGYGISTNLTSGLALDFGTGHGQAARGDLVAAIAPLAHHPVTVLATPSLTLGVDANQVLSGVVKVDSSPSAGFGRLAVGINGVAAVLGLTADVAAAGDHTHAVVTLAADGFMSKAMLSTFQGMEAQLSGVAAGGYLSTNTLRLIDTNGILSGVVICDPTPPLGNMRVIPGANGLYVDGTLSGVLNLTTTHVAEGTNLYYTTARAKADAIAAALTAFSSASGGTITSSDTVLSALGKLENRVALDDAKVTGGDRVLKAGDTMTQALQFSGGTNPGVILSNLTDTQRAALTPSMGMIIYDTTLSLAMIYNGTWQPLALGAGSGTTWFSGAGAPAGGLGADGNYYVDTGPGNIYLKTSGSWAIVYAPGSGWYSGSGTPSGGMGQNGNYYLDYGTGNVYLKAAGSWSVVYSPTGSLWFNGAGAPSGGLGVNGNYYLNVSNGDIYQKAGGSWAVIFSPGSGGTGFVPTAGGTMTGQLLFTGLAAPIDFGYGWALAGLSTTSFALNCGSGANQAFIIQTSGGGTVVDFIVGNGNINVGSNAFGFQVAGTKVVGAQVAHITHDASGAANQATVNAILAALEAHGLVHS